MPQLNKLQLKAEILTVLSKIQMDMDEETLCGLLQVLSEQEDKEALLEILVKELIRTNEKKAEAICFLMANLIEKDKLEDALWKILKMKSVKDSVKSIILTVLKDLGNVIDYNKIEDCFEDVEEVVDEGTRHLLQSAIINPEAQIDFLDFVFSLSIEDKKLLVQSLGDDFSYDSLANILNPLVLYSPDDEIGQLAIDILGSTKSQLALYSLYEVQKFSQNEVTKALVRKNISKLKISGVREENAQEFYSECLSTKPFEAYSSYPDGHGNQAIIFSREREVDDTVQMVAIVINDSMGIVDCFGFNSISKGEFSRIVDKFYDSTERLYLDFHVIKQMLTKAESLSRATDNKISYEYLCWKSLFSDVSEEVVPIEQILKAKVEQKDLNEKSFESICMTDFVQKWFFTSNDNDAFSDLVQEIDNYIKNDDYSFDLENVVNSYYNKIFGDSEFALLSERILKCTYLNYLCGKRLGAQLFYSLYLDENMKKKLAENIIRKSIYENYVALKFKKIDDSKTTNIFALKNRDDVVKFSEEQIQRVIDKIESLWVK